MSVFVNTTDDGDLWIVRNGVDVRIRTEDGVVYPTADHPEWVDELAREAGYTVERIEVESPTETETPVEAVTSD